MNKNSFCYWQASVFILFISAACSCSSPTLIKTANLDIELSSDGKITRMWIGPQKIEKKIFSFTEIEGCHLQGPVKMKTGEDGQIEFTRMMINDSLHTTCTIIDRFNKTNNSVRWDVEIIGSGSPWSMPINTVFHYPADKETTFWTTWGRPKYDLSGDKDLLKKLTPVTGASEDEAIIDTSNKDWVDPLVPVPFIDDTLFYGAPPPSFLNKSQISAEWTFYRELFSVPVFSVLQKNTKTGLSLALSPEDNILNLVMTSTADGTIQYRRYGNRISDKKTVRFSMDFIGDKDDWRPALGWMSSRYPAYFNPVNPSALTLNGTGTYSNYYADFDVQKMKDMAFTVNWQASFDFPYMGMFLPPVDPRTKWKRLGGGEMSIGAMKAYASGMQEKGFYVLNYFNITEFGTAVKYPYVPVSPGGPDTWQNCNEFLYTNFPSAILKYKEGHFPPAKKGDPIFTWKNGVVMDCGDSSYRHFLLDQASRHLREIPGSYGICIDRLDWLNIYNLEADDGISWFNDKPARSLTSSYKGLMEELGPLMHRAGKYIFANSIGRRIDYFKHLDGIFDEFAYAGTPLNTAAFICINKPALGWTDQNRTVLKNGGDLFFQKYLYMGVFPMCPFPGSDHGLQPNDSVDKLYRDYGPLLKLMQERKWVLSPHAVTVKENDAKANIFSIPEGYLIPVVYGDKQKVQLEISLDGIPAEFQCIAYYPGLERPVIINYQKEKDKITIPVDLIRNCAMVVLQTKQS